jgi:hypothetical protein
MFLTLPVSVIVCATAANENKAAVKNSNEKRKLFLITVLI